MSRRGGLNDFCLATKHVSNLSLLFLSSLLYFLCRFNIVNFARQYPGALENATSQSGQETVVFQRPSATKETGTPTKKQAASRGSMSRKRDPTILDFFSVKKQKSE